MPCGACKYQRRRCGGEGLCIFAPYFPPMSIQMFACVHHVFGRSNVGNILKFMDPMTRASAVKTLVYQAEARVRDPLQGCVGLITELEETHRKLAEDLLKAHKELGQYMTHKDIHELCPRFGDYMKGKKSDTPLAHVLLDFDATCYSILGDVDLKMWDPFPHFENIGFNDNVGTSSQMQQAHGEGENDNKRKSFDPSS